MRCGRWRCGGGCWGVRACRRGYARGLRACGAACEWKQGDVTGALDGLAQPALMARTDAGHATGQYLAALLHELRENVGAFVVDEVHLLDAELADFLFAEILALAAARAAWAAAGTSVTAAGTVSATAAWAAGAG